MKEHFFRSDRVDKATLHALMARSNGPGLIRFGIEALSLLAGAAGLVLLYDGPAWAWWLSFAILALSNTTMFAVTHESGHNTAFASKGLNQMALWFSCATTFYTPVLFRELHFTHHRHTHIPGKDPEISMAGKGIPVITSAPHVYLTWLTGIPLMVYKIGLLLMGCFAPGKAITGFAPWFRANELPKLRRQCWIVLFLHLGMIAAGIWLHAGLLWCYPAIWAGHAVLASYTVAEHQGLPHVGSIMDRTRSMRSNPVVKFFMWNMPYHAEHHAYPGIPFHALPALHRALGAEVKVQGSLYPLFHGRVWGYVFRGKAFREKK